MESLPRKSIIISCAILLWSTPPVFAQWLGHLSKLSDAQNACRNMDSNKCLPYLAQAVAVADTLNDQATVAGKTIQLPGPNGSILNCSENFSTTDLNGETLAHLALIRDPKADFYWTKALFFAALDRCRKRS